MPRISPDTVTTLRLKAEGLLQQYLDGCIAFSEFFVSMAEVDEKLWGALNAQFPESDSREW